VKYEFQNEVNVTDFGLRLADVQKYNLKSEHFRFKGRFPDDTIAAKEEQAFLRGHRRVELNAFTAPQFVEWIVSNLKGRLPERLIPEDDVLETAYRRAIALAKINRIIKTEAKKAIREAEEAPVPEDLRARLQEAMKGGLRAWDRELYRLVKKTVLSDGDEE
jgi:hypothetical protein